MKQEQTPRLPKLRIKKVLVKIYRLFAQPKVVYRTRLAFTEAQGELGAPIFLVGLHRSGTTLLRQIIDSHPNIACPPETFFLSGFADVYRNKQYTEGLDAMGFDLDGVAIGLRRSAEFFYQTYLSSKNKSRWADKTPHYVFILPFIEKLFGPSCQYVMIYRHPLDVVDSIFQKGWDFMDYDSDPFTNVLLYVKDGLDRQKKFQSQNTSRCVDLRYEDLMRDPEEALKRIFLFLGEPWDDSVLNYNDKPHDFGVGDPEAIHLSGFRPSIGNYRGWSTERLQLAKGLLGPEIEELGYSINLA